MAEVEVVERGKKGSMTWEEVDRRLAGEASGTTPAGTPAVQVLPPPKKTDWLDVENGGRCKTLLSTIAAVAPRAYLTVRVLHEKPDSSSYALLWGQAAR